MRGRVQAGHPAPGETKRSVCCSVVTRGHSCPTAGRICVEGQWPPSPRDEDRERHLPTLGQCWQITSRCLFRPRLSHRLDLVLQLSGFLLVPSFPGTSPTSQEPAPAAVSCAGSGCVEVCCSSGRAGAGQDLGTRGRCLHRQAELSVLTVTSQQDPPFFFSFPFSMLLILYLAGRSRFQTGGRSPFPEMLLLPGPLRGSVPELLFAIACTNSSRRWHQRAGFAPRDGCTRPQPVAFHGEESALGNKQTEASRQAQSEPWWRGPPQQRCTESVPRSPGRFRGSPWAPSGIWAGSGCLPSQGAEEGKLLPPR